MGKLTFARPGHQGLHPLLLQKKGMTCGKGWKARQTWS